VGRADKISRKDGVSRVGAIKKMSFLIPDAVALRKREAFERR
jgi:hypothetical protein